MTRTSSDNTEVRRLGRIAALVVLGLCVGGCQEALRINQVQFVGSHNSYKQAMSPEHFAALKARNPQAAASLEYWHLPLNEQLDLGIRKLELDVFYDPGAGRFVVGHVQDIDMNSHCATLTECLTQLVAWSDAHPRHIPLWISFNAKDQAIEGLSTPVKFDAVALELLDERLLTALADRLITPADVMGLRWPTLASARGKFILILDEQGSKREWYEDNWRNRPMFANWPEDHPGARIMIRNDPIAQGDEIRALVDQGYLVRTRADADTLEARRGDRSRLQAALDSGAQAISTDYYQPASHFDTDYVVRFAPRCNPRNTRKGCQLSEPD